MPVGGTAAAVEYIKHDIPEDEYVYKVKYENANRANLGLSITFMTTGRRELTIKGTTHRNQKRKWAKTFKAHKGNQIVALNFEAVEGDHQDLIGIHQAAKPLDQASADLDSDA